MLIVDWLCCCVYISFLALQIQIIQIRGEVVAVADDGPKILAMEQFGNRFKWPRHDDILTYSFSDVIRKLQAPIPVGTRGQFTFIC